LIRVTPLLPANAVVLRSLQLPPVYAISMAEDLGVAAFLRRAKAAVERDVRLIQLREKSFTEEAIERLAAQLLVLGASSGARLLLNGDADTARRLGCAGVHWTAARLMAARQKPDQMMCAASCHDAVELARAAELGVDFVVLGPVLATPSHANAQPLGWERFEELARRMPIPVYALGGLSRDDLGRAMQHGAHGIALRRGAWTDPQEAPGPGSASSGSVGSSATGAR
jgi:8-oxo-dGTP diphosphatase